MHPATEDPASEFDDVATTRAAYDGMADLYAELVRHALESNPFDRAMFNVFSELTAAGGPVADLGCGPGRVTAHLAARGLEVFGLDVSARMIELARAQYPQLSFGRASLERLPIADGALGGIVAWYSLIHLPPDRVPGVLREFARVLTPNGHVLLGFQTADVPNGVEAFDHKVARAYRWAPKRLARLLTDAGFTMVARMVREPRPDERFGQGCLVAVKAADRNAERTAPEN